MINAPSLEHVTDTVQDVAHTVAEKAPEIATAVGRSARSTVDTVSDAVTKLAAMTPWVEAPKQHNRARWMLRVAIVTTVAGLAMWFVNRRRQSTHSHSASDAARTDQTTHAGERRLATAGH